MRYQVELPHEADAVPRARRVIERVEGRVGEHTLRNARLLVSELVTNSVRHVPDADGEGIELAVERTDERLRVEIVDHGPGFEAHGRRIGQDPGSGWGLHILRTVASRWGVERNGGSRVWFELDEPER